MLICLKLAFQTHKCYLALLKRLQSCTYFFYIFLIHIQKIHIRFSRKSQVSPVLVFSKNFPIIYNSTFVKLSQALYMFLSKKFDKSRWNCSCSIGLTNSYIHHYFFYHIRIQTIYVLLHFIRSPECP